MIRANDEIDAPESEKDSEYAGGERKHNRFSDELPRQPPARSAQRGSHRHFLASGRGPNEDEIRHVRARDQEQNGDSATNDQQHTTNIFHQPLPQGRKTEAGCVRQRALLQFQLAANRTDFRTCLLERNRGFNAPGHSPVMRCP